jgi:hypothetical protein
MKHSSTVVFKCVLVSAVLAIAITTAQIVITQTPVQWPMAGGDLANTRSQPAEYRITRENVTTLVPKWVFTTGGDVSATPAVAGDAVYVPDWKGNLFAIRKADGQLMWSRKISDYDGVMGSYSRVTPAIHGTDLIIGDIESGTDVHKGANLIAVDRSTGTLHGLLKSINIPRPSSQVHRLYPVMSSMLACLRLKNRSRKTQLIHAALFEAAWLPSMPPPAN